MEESKRGKKEGRRGGRTARAKMSMMCPGCERSLRMSKQSPRTCSTKPSPPQNFDIASIQVPMTEKTSSPRASLRLSTDWLIPQEGAERVTRRNPRVSFVIQAFCSGRYHDCRLHIHVPRLLGTSWKEISSHPGSHYNLHSPLLATARPCLHTCTCTSGRPLLTDAKGFYNTNGQRCVND